MCGGSSEPIWRPMAYADQLRGQVGRTGWMLQPRYGHRANARFTKSMVALLHAGLYAAQVAGGLGDAVAARVGSGVTRPDEAPEVWRVLLWWQLRGRPRLQFHYERSERVCPGR